ncbi:MAG: hypothetical protein PHY92_03430 [Alphaproteobacteria bacterium]|nr:hypothetical protein [Alphaproteobacteria bacterium]
MTSDFFHRLVKNAALAERDSTIANFLLGELQAVAAMAKGDEQKISQFNYLGLSSFAEVAHKSARLAIALADYMLGMSSDKEWLRLRIFNELLLANPKKQRLNFARLAFQLCGDDATMKKRGIQYYLCKIPYVAGQENGVYQTNQYMNLVGKSCGSDEGLKIMYISFGMTKLAKLGSVSAEAALDFIGLMRRLCGNDGKLKHLFAYNGWSALQELRDGWIALVLTETILGAGGKDKKLKKKIVQTGLNLAKEFAEQGEIWAAGKIVEKLKGACIANKQLASTFVQTASVIELENTGKLNGFAPVLGKASEAIRFARRDGETKAATERFYLKNKAPYAFAAK